MNEPQIEIDAHLVIAVLRERIADLEWQLTLHAARERQQANTKAE